MDSLRIGLCLGPHNLDFWDGIGPPHQAHTKGSVSCLATCKVGAQWMVGIVASNAHQQWAGALSHAPNGVANMLTPISINPQLPGMLHGLLDYGVSRHIIGQRNFLFDIIPIAPCYFGLPNGSSTVTKYAGNVMLSPSLTLHNILYVPIVLVIYYLSHNC